MASAGVCHLHHGGVDQACEGFLCEIGKTAWFNADQST